MDPSPDRTPMEATARAVAAEWGLELGEPFARSRFSFVAPVGDDAVLKVASVQDDESVHEPEALTLWAGDGAVRLLRDDPSRRAMLLERARPGDDLAGLPEAEAVAIAVDVARRLWRPATGPFAWIGDRVPRWIANGAARGAAGSELVPLARELLDELQVGRSTLVHGDLHHHNILRHRDRHLAIDPKAMVGEPEYDVAPFLWNPLGVAMTDRDRAEGRIAAFVAAGLDDRRIRAWTAIRASYLGATPDEVALTAALAE